MIYGTSSKKLTTESVYDKCPYCGLQTSLTLYVFQEYIHVLWIPAIPSGKKVVCQCENCKKEMQLNQMSPSLKSQSEELKARSKTPIWTFTGIALILMVVGIGIFNFQQKKANSAKYILTPAQGDIYEIKIASGQYTLYKVKSVGTDSVFVNPSLYETNLESGISDLISKNSYSDEIFGIAKKKIKQMFEDDQVLGVHRN